MLSDFIYTLQKKEKTRETKIKKSAIRIGEILHYSKTR